MSARSSSLPALTIDFRDIYAYHFDETRRWREWFAKQPDAALDVPIGEAPVSTVRDMLFHIFLVEWVYVRALNGEPWDGWQKFKHETLVDVLKVADESQSGLKAILDRETPASLEADAELKAPQVTMKGSRRKFLMHTFVHGSRHWAQVAMALRANGFKTDWQHDLVMSDVIK